MAVPAGEHEGPPVSSRSHPRFLGEGKHIPPADVGMGMGMGDRRECANDQRYVGT